VHSYHLPTSMEWSHLLLHDVIFSKRITLHFQWGENLSLMTLTFDLHIQTIPGEGPNKSSMRIWRKSVQQFLRHFIHKQTKENKKVTGDSAKNRTLCSSLCAVKMVKRIPNTTPILCNTATKKNYFICHKYIFKYSNIQYVY